MDGLGQSAGADRQLVPQDATLAGWSRGRGEGFQWTQRGRQAGLRHVTSLGDQAED